MDKFDDLKVGNRYLFEREINRLILRLGKTITEAVVLEKSAISIKLEIKNAQNQLRCEWISKSDFDEWSIREDLGAAKPKKKKPGPKPNPNR